jgi:serine/threonine protein kinase
LVTPKFKIIKVLGEGSFGQVVKAIECDTSKVFAIKMIENVFESTYNFKKIIREI